MEDDDADTASYYLNEGVDEDEFGLPSITSMRKSARRSPVKQFNDPGGGVGASTNGAFYSLEPPRRPGRGRANSSDIALERGPPSYPATKGGEGKILRPQYKDILRGISLLHASSILLMQS